MPYKINRSDELYHTGIEGMKWGIRRYQNKDGSLTEEGKERYYKGKGLDKSRKAFEEKREGTNQGKYSTESYRKLRKGKYKDLADTLDRSIEEKRVQAQKAWDEYMNAGKHFLQFKRNKEERSAASEKFDKSYDAMMDQLFATSEKYIKERFTKEQWDDARAFVYDYSELWDGNRSSFIDMD